MPSESRIADRLCALIAANAAQDPIGSGSSVSRLLAVETPGPWGDDLYTADPDGTVRQRIRAHQARYFDEIRELPNWEEHFVRGYPAHYGIQPDAEWSEAGFTRVLLATGPEGLFHDFEMAEYRFPDESPRLAELAEAFFFRPDALSDFEAFRIERTARREFFVCTHGHVDICCARLGIPLYRQARAAYPEVRTWRMTHFGGHRFAPTAWEFPSGYKWGFLDETATRQVIEQSGSAADVAANIRGWSGAEGQSQLLDREGLRRHGWAWLGFDRRGVIVSADDANQRWDVRLDFVSPEGTRGTYTGTVVVRRELQDVGCGPHYGEHEYASPEYELDSFSES